jgi:hypothetical protein
MMHQGPHADDFGHPVRANHALSGMSSLTPEEG